MEEIYQITSALRHLPFGKQVAVITDARFSGVSTGACIGHISPEALAGGPIGKLRDGDVIRDRDRSHRRWKASVESRRRESALELGVEEGTRILDERPLRPDLAADPALPDDTRIWAALQDVSGGTWGGAVYDAEAILKVIAAGKAELSVAGKRASQKNE